MAMTVRLPPELDAALEKLAAERHTSKHALLIEGATRVVDSEARVERATGVAASVRDRYADLLSRLEDA
jgi:predicted transcriptional regulator